jgi:SAM-dependent methyltransferase
MPEQTGEQRGPARFGAEEMQAYYALDKERDRLADGIGRVEFLRTVELISRTLPSPPAVVADIGGGPGRYTDWLVERGYDVVHRDLVKHHVAQVADRYRPGSDRSPGPSVDTGVCDARRLDLDDESVDAVVLCGPLYHLVDRADRVLVGREALRVVRPGGPIYAAAISTWAPRLDAILHKGAHRTYPEVLEWIADVEATGVLPPITEGGFNAYCHSPDDLAAELTDSGLEVEQVVAIEGPASLLGAEVIDRWLADDDEIAVLLDTLRAVETVPSLIGVSGHLLAVAHRPPANPRPA